MNIRAKGADLGLPYPFDAAVVILMKRKDMTRRGFLLPPVWGRRERSAVGRVNRPWMACLVPSQHGCCVGTALPEALRSRLARRAASTGCISLVTFFVQAKKVTRPYQSRCEQRATLRRAKKPTNRSKTVALFRPFPRRGFAKSMFDTGELLSLLAQRK